MNNTRHRIAFVSRLAISVLKQSALMTAVSLCMVCGVLADDIAVSEQSFGCINNRPKIRNTHIYNSDPEKLKEAIRIFRDSVPDTEYPVGAILQLIPTEAMVKHSRGTFAKSNDWEFFSLDVSADQRSRRKRRQSHARADVSELSSACREVRLCVRKDARVCSLTLGRSKDRRASRSRPSLC
jgi:hypothetical protein